jgi:NADH-quinone oxidoreductase subunit C
MPLTPAITAIDQLKDRPEVARLLAANAEAISAAKYDRDELTVWVDRAFIREAVALLRDDAELRYNFFADLTCVDWHPTIPRFEVCYHLLSIPRKARVRLKVRLAEDEPIESITSVWPSADFYEREVFDLFGIRFVGHPNLKRILMPEDWEGHPLRKDYPVEGYR